MKFFKKFLCILLAAVLISLSPMIDYVNINKMETVEASGTVVGTAALLQLVLGAFGVTVAATALDGITDTFDDWIRTNGATESIEAWDAASLQKYVTVVPSLVSDVASWLGTKFDDLSGGSVVSCPNFTPYMLYGPFDEFTSFAYQFALSKTAVAAPYFLRVYVNSRFASTDGTLTGADTNTYIYPLPSNVIAVKYSSKTYFYALNGDILTKTSLNSSYLVNLVSTSGKFEISTASASYASTKSIMGTYLYNCPYIFASSSSAPSEVSLSALLANCTSYGNLDYSLDAFISYGNYDSVNVDGLSNLLVTPTIISSILSLVNDAVAANKSEDEEDNVVWSDAIAQAVSDAYAAGLADAKAQQGELKDDVKEEERTTVITGWLSKIYDAILTIPTAITQGVDILSDVFEVSVDIKDLITVIPTTIIEGFKEVFPTAETVAELIMGIPASMVDALTEVFPVADDLKEWITSVPASIVDAISTGVGVIADGLTAVKDAVLSIPLAIADAIALVLEGLFVPDLTLVEAELDNISDALGWIGDLNSLINDFMLRLEAGDPPTVYLDFTKAEDSKYYGAGLCLAIDFSWYAKYKPTVDLIIGAFIWVMFFWYLFKRIPDIISGAGFITRDSDEVSIRKNKNNKKGGD